MLLVAVASLSLVACDKVQETANQSVEQLNNAASVVEESVSNAASDVVQNVKGAVEEKSENLVDQVVGKVKEMVSSDEKPADITDKYFAFKTDKDVFLVVNNELQMNEGVSLETKRSEDGDKITFETTKNSPVFVLTYDKNTLEFSLKEDGKEKTGKGELLDLSGDEQAPSENK